MVSGVVAGATLVLALVVASAVHAPITVVYGALLVAAWLAARGPSARVVGPHGPFAAAGAVVFVVPFVWLGARMALSEPLVVSTYGRCGTPMAMAAIAAPFIVGAAGFLGFLISERVGARVPAPGPRLTRFLLGAATIGLVLATAMVVRATLRTRGRPAPDAFIEGLPFVARLGDLPFGPYVDPAPPPSDHGPAFSEQATLPTGEVLLRGCDATSCRVALRVAGKAPAALGVLGVGRETFVRRLPNGYVFATPTWVEGALTHDGRKLDVHVHDLATNLSAPRGWLAGALVATALAALAVSRARRLRADTEGLLDGVVVDEGVVLEDGSVWAPGPTAAALPVGTAVLARSPAAPTFRDVPQPPFVPGSKAALEAAVRRDVLLTTTFALLVLLLGLAPLAAAAWSRLV